MLVCLHPLAPASGIRLRLVHPSEARTSCLSVLRCLREPPEEGIYSAFFLHRVLRVFLRVSASPRQIERLVPSTALHARRCSLRLSQRLCVSGKSHSGLVTASPPYGACSYSLLFCSPPPPLPSPTSACSVKTPAPGPTSSPPSALSASPPACRGS